MLSSFLWGILWGEFRWEVKLCLRSCSLEDEFIRQLSNKEIRKLTFRALALRRSESRNCGLCVVYIQNYGATLLVGSWQRENTINQSNEKCSLIPWRLRVPIWKINFCSRVLRLSVLPWCRERPPTATCCVEWFGRLKCTHNPQLLDSLRRRANDRNVSFRISLRWPIHIINPVHKTKLSCNTPTDAASQFL